MNISYHKITYNEELAIMSLAVDQTERIKSELKLEQERKRKQNEITAAVINAQEKEKEQLSKELHDNINQILTVTKLMVEHGLANKMNQEEVLSLNLYHLTTAINEIRKLSQSLMPPSLNDTTLNESLNQMIQNYNALDLFKINYINELNQEDLIDGPLKLTIFRIIQEQLNNIVKHSGANKVELIIKPEDNELFITIIDNGRGFDVSAGNGGLGLKNIKSRSNLYNGRINIVSEINVGTKLEVVFPIKKAL
jgi:two-component system, NarL family, sensor histidine kinase UhpB